MEQIQLHQYQGAAIDISVDGAEAIGMLFFSEHNEAYVVSMCYTKRRARCPQIQRMLSPEEIENIMPAARNKLRSSIDVSSTAKSAPASSACVEAGPGSTSLMARVQSARQKTRRISAEFDQLKAEGAALVGKLRNAQDRLLATRRKSAPCSSRSRQRVRAK